MPNSGLFQDLRKKRTNDLILFTFLLVISVGISYSLSLGSKIVAIGAFAVFGGIFVFIHAISFLKFGLTVVLILSLTVNGLKRLTLTELPLGTLVDVLCMILLLVVLINSKQTKYKLPLDSYGLCLILYFFYNAIQVFNPGSVSPLAWFHGIRFIFIIISIYFITLGIINSIKDIDFFLKAIIAFCFALGVYGLYQEFHGFLSFESQWIFSTNQYGLLFTFGRWRKFSFLSSPMIFGILMAVIGITSIIVGLGEKSKTSKFIYIIAGLTMLWSMLFTGTRTAYVLVPAGVLFFAFLTLKKNILIICGASLFVLAFIIIAPTNNPNLYIFKTAFSPKSDASYMVRKHNQAFIQPYIKSHPVGSGIGSVGFGAAMYAPNSPLANFPPDSELVKVAIDLGWFGLLFYCILWFAILKIGVEAYFSIRDERLKTLSAAFTCTVFLFFLSNYPQEAVQLEAMVIISIISGIISKLKYLEGQEPA